MIRIISGKYRGKRIRAPKNLPVRPTTDRAKESLFNILNNELYFDEIKALDLFSGTGNISYELASRGCTDITAVDENRASVQFIERIAAEMNLEGFQAIQAEVIKFLNRAYESFDLIFCDPPYDYDHYDQMIEQIFMQGLLKEDGLLVVEHQSRNSLEHLHNHHSTRIYGNVAFSFFRRQEED